MESWVVFSAFSVLTLLIFRYPDNLVGTRSRVGIPGPKGWPLIGNFPEIFPWRTRIVDWIWLMHERYGDLCTFTMPPWGRGIIIGRPEWLAHVKAGMSRTTGDCLTILIQFIEDMVKYTSVHYGADVLREFPGKSTPIATHGAEWRRLRKIMAYVPITTHGLISLPIGQSLGSSRSVIMWAMRCTRCRLVDNPTTLRVLTLTQIMNNATVLMDVCADRDITVDWNGT